MDSVGQSLVEAQRGLVRLVKMGKGSIHPRSSWSTDIKHEKGDSFVGGELQQETDFSKKIPLLVEVDDAPWKRILTKCISFETPSSGHVLRFTCEVLCPHIRRRILSSQFCII